MKKLAILFVALFISATSFAQIGVIGGLTTSATNLKEASKLLKSKMICQYHVGLTYKIGLGNIIALQPAVIYNVKGAMLENQVITDLSLDYKTGYVEVPIQLQAGVGIGNAVRVYGIAEPFLGYAVANKIKIEDTVKETWDNVKNRFEWGASLGAGVELFKHFQINLKYFWNFGQVYENDYKDIMNTAPGGISLSAAFIL